MAPDPTSSGAVRAVGDAGLLIEVAGTELAQALAVELRGRSLPGVVDVVPGMASVLLVFDRGLDVHGTGDASALAAAGALPGGRRVADAVGAAVSSASSPSEAGGTAAGARLHEIPVVFDGPDLEEVADRCATTAPRVRAALAASELSVTLLGFSPGFAYLGGLDRPLAEMPRRATPRAVVPAGSVAVAGGYAAVYPQATPGGWQLVGRTTFELFDPETPPFASLQPGDRVRFSPVDELPPRSDAVGAQAGEAGRAVFEVLDAGLRTLVEDGGRRGVAHLGVPRSGAADAESHWLANGLVGNAHDAAALEVTGRGPTLRCVADAFVAAVGGDVTLAVDGRRVPSGVVLPVGAGQRLEVGATTTALRAVLAVAGGIAVTPTLGGSGTDTLSWTGPAPLAAGDVVRAYEGGAPLGGHLVPASVSSGSPGWPLRVLAGPHPEWFGADALDELSAMSFTVAADSDRVGVRLVPDGPRGVSRRAGELASTGMVVGAVQVPPSGEPVVLGPDHATLGGYPVLAVVIGADLPLLGRCRPGDTVRLVPVSAHEAAGAWRRGESGRRRAVVGHYPTIPAT